MSLELVHLCDARLVLSDPISASETPLGTRLIYQLERAEFEGDRLRASCRSGAASGDWVTLDSRGIATLDVRIVLETYDGAVILSSYRGRCDLSAAGTVYIAPTYDTGDERYRWLNSIQAVGKGAVGGNLLTYEIFEVR